MQRRISALWISIALLLVTGSAFAQEEGEVGAAETTDVAEEPAEEAFVDTSAETSAIPAEEGAGEAAPPASAAKPISVGLLLGFGLDLGGTGPMNPFGLGFGVRGGYNLNEIYLGARFMFFLGDSIDTPFGDTSFNVMMLGVEGGYDLAFGKLTVRPELGLGLAIASQETLFVDPFTGTSATADGSSTDVYIALGGAVLYDVTDSIFVGGDLQIPIVLAGSTFTGLTILANGGMRF